MADLRSKISGISKGKRIKGEIVEVFNGYATVSTSGRLYKGLNIIGGPLTVGQKVFIDFSSGTPIVHAYSSSINASKTTLTRTITTRIVSDNEFVDPDKLLEPGNHSHTESQIIDLNHDAQKIKGVSVDQPTADNDQEVLIYDRTNNRLFFGKISVSQINSENAVLGRIVGADGIGGAGWIEQSGSSGGSTGGSSVLQNHIFS